MGKLTWLYMLSYTIKSAELCSFFGRGGWKNDKHLFYRNGWIREKNI